VTAFAKLRGLLLRTVVGAALVALVALSLWLWHWGLVIIIAAIMALGAHELAAAAARHGWHPVWPVVVVGAPALIILEYTGWCGDVLPVGLVGCVVIVLVAWAVRLRGPVAGFLVDAAATALIVAYLPLTLTFAIAMMKSAHPVAQIATYGTCMVIADSGAYIVGSLLGRHKMAPHISPAKTWEGFGGAIAAAAVAGWLLGVFVLGAPWWQGVALGVALGVGSVIGDLIESAIKRDVGIKDMGKLLPGHGGAMDRLDSLVFCAPIAWAIMNLWMVST